MDRNRMAGCGAQPSPEYPTDDVGERRFMDGS
jgi:hypothetical protein